MRHHVVDSRLHYCPELVSWQTHDAVQRHHMELVYSIYSRPTGTLMVHLFRLPNGRCVGVENIRNEYVAFVPVSRADAVKAEAEADIWGNYGIHAYPEEEN